MIKVHFNGSAWVVTLFGKPQAVYPWRYQAAFHASFLLERGKNALKFWKEPL